MNRNFRPLIGFASLSVWAAGLMIVTATLMLGHWVELPHPETGTRFPSAGEITSTPGNKLKTIHFLYGNCPCSKKVLKHAVQRKPHPHVDETIILIDGSDDEASLAEENGFPVIRLTPDESKERFGIDSAPLMLVLNREEQIIYSGGYTSRKRGLDYADLMILDRLLSGKEVRELPVYGCAVSKELKSIVDPLGLKDLN